MMVKLIVLLAHLTLLMAPELLTIVNLVHQVSIAQQTQ